MSFTVEFLGGSRDGHRTTIQGAPPKTVTVPVNLFELIGHGLAKMCGNETKLRTRKYHLVQRDDHTLWYVYEGMTPEGVERCRKGTSK